MHRIPRYDIYTDRRNERALCQDFPADEALIHGLHLMQAYLRARGATIDIPVVRVMNTAHYLATYMLSTPCTDQTEYDMRVYCDLGCDKKLASIAIIALAAMLQRIDNPRAKTCRSALLEDRSDDFYEGLSMYEQWLNGYTEHYADEDFCIDVMDELTIAKQQIQYLQNKLQNQLTMKEAKNVTHIGYNVENMTINMSGGTLVQHADLVQASGEVVVGASEHSDLLSQSNGQSSAVSAHTSFCSYLVPEKIAEMGICTMEQAEAELKAESEKDAKHFAAYLRKKEKAGTLYFHGDNKKQILASLQAHFPNMKRYTYNNFIAYF